MPRRVTDAKGGRYLELLVFSLFVDDRFLQHRHLSSHFGELTG